MIELHPVHLNHLTRDLAYLCGPEVAGRLSGTKGARMAAGLSAVGLGQQPTRPGGLAAHTPDDSLNALYLPAVAAGAARVVEMVTRLALNPGRPGEFEDGASGGGCHWQRAPPITQSPGYATLLLSAWSLIAHHQ